MNKNVSTFIFDCFGVVCDPVLYSWYYDMSLKHGFTDDRLSDVLRKFDLGILSEEGILDHFLSYKGINSTREQVCNEIDSYLQIDQNLVIIINKLKAQGYKIALLSNGNNSFFERKIYTTYPEFKNLFDEIVISSEVGMVKPDPKIYLHTLQLMKSTPEESLFIDDSRPNVDIAVSLGMDGFVYTNSPSFADYLTERGINFQ